MIHVVRVETSRIVSLGTYRSLGDACISMLKNQTGQPEGIVKNLANAELSPSAYCRIDDGDHPGTPPVVGIYAILLPSFLPEQP